jgi:Tfp pilus assembly protein PilE
MAGRPAPASQRGVTLIVALIMLTALGLLAAFAIRAGSANLQIVHNTQMRHEAFAAAQAAVERTLSSPAFVTQPAAVAANPVAVDLNGDGVADLSASIDPAPSCYRWRAVKVSELNPATSADRACLGSSQSGNTGIETSGGSPSGDSLCADSEWNIRATVTDPQSGASVAVNQGIAARGLITDVTTACP